VKAEIAEISAIDRAPADRRNPRWQLIVVHNSGSISAKQFEISSFALQRAQLFARACPGRARRQGGDSRKIKTLGVRHEKICSPTASRRICIACEKHAG